MKKTNRSNIINSEKLFILETMDYILVLLDKIANYYYKNNLHSQCNRLNTIAKHLLNDMELMYSYLSENEKQVYQNRIDKLLNVPNEENNT